MIISLIGFMGCGKSSVGRRLSELLCCRFMDLDNVIEEREGRTIAEIFAAEGEARFREIELESLLAVVEGECSKTESLPRLRRGPLPFTRPRAATVFDSSPLHNGQAKRSEVIDEVAEANAKESPHLILALGGGAVMTKECAESVRKNTVCIYIRASVDTLLEHLASEAEERPLLARNTELRSRIENLLSQRTAIYENTAHIVVDTDNKTIEQIAYEISTLI